MQRQKKSGIVMQVINNWKTGGKLLQSPITSFQLLVTSYQFPVSTYQFTLTAAIKFLPGAWIPLANAR